MKRDSFYFSLFTNRLIHNYKWYESPRQEEILHYVQDKSEGALTWALCNHGQSPPGGIAVSEEESAKETKGETDG